MNFPKLKILAISDLHMDGVSGAPFSCKFSDDDIHTYLIWALKKYDTIILNGDIFDLIHEKDDTPFNSGESYDNLVIGKSKESFSTIELLYPQTVKLIRDGGISYLPGKIVYINGNHDSVCRVCNIIPNVVQNYTVTGKFPIYFAHGHQADIWNRDDSCLKNVTTCCYCCSDILGEVLSIPNLDEDFRLLASTINSREVQETYVKHAHKVGRRGGYSCVIYAHTHTPSLQLLDDGFIYANSGKAGSDPDHNDKINEIEIEIYDNRIIVTLQERYVRTYHLDVIKRVIKDEHGSFIEEINTRRNFRVGGESDGQIRRAASI
jgi:predicted phosphodiesterase